MNTKNMKRTAAALLMIGTAVSINVVNAQAIDFSNTQEQYDVIVSKIDEQTEIKDNAHWMAEYARALGESEDSVIIQSAIDYWQDAHSEHQRLTDEKERLAAKLEQEKKERESKGKYLGKFKITHYCLCAKCNGNNAGIGASGRKLVPGLSIAVDPRVIPMGSTVYIEGLGTRRADDTGSAIKSNKIDVCVSSHAEAYRKGVYYTDVYLK